MCPNRNVWSKFSKLWRSVCSKLRPEMKYEKFFLQFATLVAWMAAIWSTLSLMMRALLNRRPKIHFRMKFIFLALSLKWKWMTEIECYARARVKHMKLNWVVCRQPTATFHRALVFRHYHFGVYQNPEKSPASRVRQKPTFKYTHRVCIKPILAFSLNRSNDDKYRGNNLRFCHFLAILADELTYTGKKRREENEH